MSSVSDEPASEELEPFDLSKMTAREIAAELVRRSHPTPAQTPTLAQTSTSASALSSPPPASPEQAGAPSADPADTSQDVVTPLPSFLREIDRSGKAASWEWPADSSEREARDPLDMLSRALHNHLQERAEERGSLPPDSTSHSAAGSSASVSPASISRVPVSPAFMPRMTADPAASSPNQAFPSQTSPNEASPNQETQPQDVPSLRTEAPLIPSSAITGGPAVAAETAWSPALRSARLPDSLDIPVQPSSFNRPPDSVLPAGLSPGNALPGYAFGSTSPGNASPGNVSPANISLGGAATAQAMAAEPAMVTLSARRLSDDDGAETTRPAIRRIPSSERATERAKVLARLWLASASAQASTYAARLHFARKDRPVDTAEVAEVDGPDTTISDSMISDPMCAETIVPSSIVSEDFVPERIRPAWLRLPALKVHWQRPAWAHLPKGRLPWRDGRWRNIHWEAVAVGVLLGAALTIGPAIYFLTAPGRAPALTEVAPGADTGQPSAPEVALAPITTPTTTAAVALPPPPAEPAPPPPPTILLPDPTTLVTAAGGTSATAAQTATSVTPDNDASSSAASKAPASTASTTPAVKPATQKASTKKLKPKPGTVSAHQANTTQLSPAKR